MTEYPMISGAILDSLSNELGVTTDMGKLALRDSLKDIQLLDRKHKDYGPQNIGKFGYSGVLIRLSDKLERLIHLSRLTHGSDPEFESVEDTLMDISNYGLIGRLCLKGEWK